MAGDKNPSPRPRFYLAAFVGVPFVFVATVSLVARLVLDASYYDSFLGELWIAIGKFYLFVFLNIVFSGILYFSTLIVLRFLPLHLFISEPSHSKFNSVLHVPFSRSDILAMIEEVQSRIEVGGSIESDELLDFYLSILEDLAGHRKIPLQEIAKPRSPEDIYNELFRLASNP